MPHVVPQAVLTQLAYCMQSLPQGYQTYYNADNCQLTYNLLWRFELNFTSKINRVKYPVLLYISLMHFVQPTARTKPQLHKWFIIHDETQTIRSQLYIIIYTVY